MTKNKSYLNKCVMCNSYENDVLGSGTDYQYYNTDQIFSWLKCKKCNHHYINPLPSNEFLQVLYKGIGNYGEFDSKPGLAFRVKRYLDKISFKKFVRNDLKELRFLDVGCSPGAMMDIVSNYYTEFKVLDGIEISEEAAFVPKKKGYNVFVGIAEEIKLEQNYYDLIYMQQVIEHLTEPIKVIKNLYNSLRTGGKLVIETPGLFTWDYKLFKKGSWEAYHIPRHLNIWTEEGMYKLLKNSGFNKIQHNYKLRPNHWTLSIQNHLRYKNKFKWFQKRLDMNVRFPLEIIFFTVIEIIQKILTKKTSDVQYITEK